MADDERKPYEPYQRNDEGTLLNRRTIRRTLACPYLQRKYAGLCDELRMMIKLDKDHERLEVQELASFLHTMRHNHKMLEYRKRTYYLVLGRLRKQEEENAELILGPKPVTNKEWARRRLKLKRTNERLNAIAREVGLPEVPRPKPIGGFIDEPEPTDDELRKLQDST